MPELLRIRGARVHNLKNVSLDLGSFISNDVAPILKDVQTVTKPLAPIIKQLTDPIPVISDLAKKPVTLLDLAQEFGGAKFNRGLIDSLIAIVNLVNSIPTDGSTLAISFGDFIVSDGSSKNDLRTPGKKLADTPNTANDSSFSLDQQVANPTGKITPAAGSGSKPGSY